MKKKTSTRLLIIIFCTAIVIFLIFKVREASIKTRAAFNEDLPSTYELTKDDSALIESKYFSKIEVIEVLRSKVRNPISFLSYEENYSMIIYKIDSRTTTSLKNMIHISKKNVDPTTNTVYAVKDDGLFKFKYKAGTVDNVKNIYLTFSGENMDPTIESDDEMGYTFLCNNLSISYDLDKEIDIYLERTERLIPTEIIFTKRDNSIYLILMIPKSQNVQIQPGLLSDILS